MWECTAYDEDEDGELGLYTCTSTKVLLCERVHQIPTSSQFTKIAQQTSLTHPEGSDAKADVATKSNCHEPLIVSASVVLLCCMPLSPCRY